jgi:hypothetical protein
MGNTDTQATLDTQDTGRRQTNVTRVSIKNGRQSRNISNINRFKTQSEQQQNMQRTTQKPNKICNTDPRQILDGNVDSKQYRLSH